MAPGDVGYAGSAPVPPSSFFASVSFPTAPEAKEIVSAPRVPEAPRQQQKSAEALPLEDARKEIEQLNKVMEGIGSRLEFGFYEDTEQFYVQMVDRDQNRVVKMMPPEYLLDLRSRIHDAVGVILDEKR